MATPPFFPDKGPTLIAHTNPDLLDNAMQSPAVFGADSTPAVLLHVTYPSEHVATLGMNGPPAPTVPKKQGVKRSTWIALLNC
jgi:hypothetical protein